MDEQQELPARFWIRDVPAPIVFGPAGRSIGARSGGMNPQQFQEFLRESLAEPNSPLAAIGDQLCRLEIAAPEEVESTVEDIIEMFGQPDRFGREPIPATLKTTGDAVVPALLPSMVDSRLAFRAAPGHALQHVTGSALPFQPFDPIAERNQQIEAWHKKVDIE